MAVADPDLKLRGGPGSALLALLVVLVSAVFFLFLPKIRCRGRTPPLCPSLHDQSTVLQRRKAEG